MIAGVSSLSQLVFGCQPFEVRTREVVEHQAVIESKQRAQLFLQIALDRLLSSEKLIEGSIQAILGDRAVGNTQEVLEAGRRVPVLCQGEFLAGGAQAVDHLDGHDVGGADRFFALGNMPVEDLVELEVSPEPQGQPDVAELARIGPSHRFQVDPDEVGIVGRGDLVVVREETELPIFALLVVKPDGALPATFLVVVELAEVGDDALSRTGLGADAFHQVPSRETAG